ncbi:MAG: PEP-CTERM sorting domain-containing protein, partial [Phycisphaerae bacterium]|nr:PEP-CTERM sorting domain-containing protein [Phycisphaerae bacterium]
MHIRTLIGAAVVAAATTAPAAVITQWDFNGSSATTVPGGATSPTPSIGSGTASLIGGTTASFASGIANGGSSDPVTTSPPNFGWNTTTYPAQGTNEGTAGVRFNVSTVGVSGPGLFAYFDLRHSNTSSRFVRLDYSTDGVN